MYVSVTPGLKRSSGQDVASKSLSDLESLVDQIPSIAESGGQRLAQQHGGHLGDDGGSLADKLEAHQSYMAGYASNSNYSPPLSQPSGMYGDSYGGSPAYARQEPSGKSAYTVENLASSNYTPSYPNVIPSPHYPVPMSAASSSNGYLFGGLDVQRAGGYGPMSAAHHHPSLHMANAYPYNASSYASSFDAYSSPATASSPAANMAYQGYAEPGASPQASSTPPAYLQQQQTGPSRPPLDLAYDAV